MSEYVGSDILETSAALVNYNRAIAQGVIANASSGSNVLDFGAGIGTLTLAVRKLGLEPACIELDEKQRGKLEALGFRTFSSLTDVPAASIDYIYSSNVLEHIDDDVAVLRELRSKLRPGGRIMLYVPAFASLYSSMDKAVGHVRRYEKNSLSERLVSAGFIVDKLQYADFFGYFATKLFMRLGDSTNNINTRNLFIYDRLIFPVGRFLESIVDVPVGKNVVAVATNPISSG